MPLEPPAEFTRGTLYVVATPIGNLGDLSLRATTILKQVDHIVAEDTRVTRILLQHIASSVPISRMDAHNESHCTVDILYKLQRGASIALVSDAGTPAISDPGTHLVFEAHCAGVRVVPIPGSSAPITLASASGLVCGPFHFEGFLPRKEKLRANRLVHLANMPHSVVLLESPHRIGNTLSAIHSVFEENRWICLGRELTKYFEEVHVCQVRSLMEWLQPYRQRGEFTIVISPAHFRLADDKNFANTDGEAKSPPTFGSPHSTSPLGDSLGLCTNDLLKSLLEDMPLSQAVKLTQKISKMPHKLIYEAALALKENGRI